MTSPNTRADEVWNMRIKVIFKYDISPHEKIVEVKEGATIVEVLYKLGIRYDSVIISYKSRIIYEPFSVKVKEGESIEILQLSDGG